MMSTSAIETSTPFDVAHEISTRFRDAGKSVRLAVPSGQNPFVALANWLVNSSGSLRGCTAAAVLEELIPMMKKGASSTKSLTGQGQRVFLPH